jgi:uncharacterized protein YwqG
MEISPENIYNEGCMAYKVEDYKSALECFTKAAELGHVDAIIRLGNAYSYDSNLCEVDIEKAMAWYEKAVELGNVSAIETLACCYINKDKDKAFELFVKAAELGSISAIEYLALDYEMGYSQERSLEKAKEYYQKAIDLGSTNAKRRLRKILKPKKRVNTARIRRVIRQYKNVTKKKCYVIVVVDGEPTHLDSSIGGTPYLPIGETIPTDKSGNPMVLFVQLNLEGTSLPNYPNKGILQVFLGIDEDYPTEHAVRYYERITEDYQKDVEQVENWWVRKPIKVDLIKSKCFLPPTDTNFGETLLPVYNSVMGKSYDYYDDIKEYDDILYSLFGYNPYANYGGYADTTQSEDFNYAENEVLIKIDSELSPLISIGDLGMLWVLITKEDLQSGKITKAWVGWDCH